MSLWETLKAIWQDARPFRGPRLLGERQFPTWNACEYVVSYVLNVLTGLAVWLYLLPPFNRLTVIGRRHLRRIPRNTLVVSNHVTLLDSWLISTALFFPRSMLRSSLMPWHVPERMNFTDPPSLVKRSPPLAWLIAKVFKYWRCIPVTRGRNASARELFRKVQKVLPRGVVYLFPGGTRERAGAIFHAQPGVGKIVADCDPYVLPTYHTGYYFTAPRENRHPQRLFGNHLTVIVGQPEKLQRNACSSRVGERALWVRLADECGEHLYALADRLQTRSSKPRAT